MFRFYISTALLIFIGSASSLRADSICVASGACDQNWQPFVTPIQHAEGPGPVGSTYFDGWSFDGPNDNIAYFIEGQGAFLNNPVSPDAQLPFWGNADGSSVNSFYFTSGGQSQLATLTFTSALTAGEDMIGWYDPNSDAWGWIFQGDGTNPSVPESVEFTPTNEFGLFVVPDSLTYPAPAFYTNTALNGIPQEDIDYAAANGITLGFETPYQHFAVFSNLNGGYYIGLNDRSNQISDLDYQDLVFTLAPVPEPGYFPVLAILFAVSLLASRRGFKA